MRSDLKPLVRGAYDIQKLRIQMGNRIVGNFKAKLGQAPSQKEEEIDDAKAKKLLKELRERFKKITNGVKSLLPSRVKFVGDELISTYTELCLLAQYQELERHGNFKYQSLNLNFRIRRNHYHRSRMAYH